jgi:hypothetical protein
MKGTLFSADFVKDADSNLRLLEFNTDTGFVTNTLSTRFDFTDFINILSTNNITELVIIYKKMQDNFVDLLETTIASDATFITTVTKQLESSDGIYPTAPTDSSSKFILRLAYDENALFDSTYCKDRANVQKLFYTNSATGSIPEFYHSGSDYTANTLTSDVNDHATLPDFVIKTKTEAHSPLKFINMGNSTSSSIDRISDYITNYHESDTKTFEKFHYNNSEVTTSGRVSSIRIVGIVYGTNIDLITIGQWKANAFLDTPVDIEVNYIVDTDIVTEYHDKHYFQLTSNFLRVTKDGGLYENSVVINSSEVGVDIQSLTIGDSVKSIFINGLPDSDNTDVFSAWSSSGLQFPSGSYVSSSLVESNVILNTNLAYGVVGEIRVHSNESIYSTLGKHYLVYNTGSNEMSFKSQYIIDSTNDFLIGTTGTLIPIISNKLIVLENNETGSLYKLDVESLDSYIISSSVEPFIAHNACFPAGTLITLSDGTQIGIENIKIGDSVLSYNGEIQEPKEVYELTQPIHNDFVKYTLSNGTTIISTFDHPYYVNNGLSSFKPEWTTTRYKLPEVINQIKINDSVFHVDGNELTITNIEVQPEVDTQTYIFSVKDNPNFYANGILVHNKFLEPTCFLQGTEISLANGDVKNIEDIVIGDIVQSYVSADDSNEIGEYKPGTVTDIDHRHNVGSHESACISLGDTAGVYNINGSDLKFTPEHPFLTKRGWASLTPIPHQEPYLSQQDEMLILSIGDSVLNDGKWELVETIDHTPMDVTTPVYNITVSEHRTYIANNIVVHNKI